MLDQPAERVATAQYPLPLGDAYQFLLAREFLAMASLAVVVVTALATLLVAGVEAARFDDVVQPSWANDHMVYDGDLLKLRLDPNSGP
jgi:hypothetical protein